MVLPPPGGASEDAPGLPISSQVDVAGVGDARRVASTDLIDRAREGDRDALALLWRQYAPHVVRLLAIQRIPDPESHAARIWSEIGNTIARFEGDGEAFRRWVLLVAGRHAHLARPDLDPEASNAEPAPIDMALRDGDVDDALAALTALPPPNAEAVMLRHVHGLSVADTATIAAVDPGQARLLAHEGTRRLRSLLSVTDDNGQVVERGSEVNVTESLRQPGTDGELAAEARHVDMLLSSMSSTVGLTSIDDDERRRRRRALAFVASAVILLGGGVMFTSLATGQQPVAGLAVDVDVDGPSGSAGVREYIQTVDEDGVPIDGTSTEEEDTELAAAERRTGTIQVAVDDGSVSTSDGSATETVAPRRDRTSAPAAGPPAPAAIPTAPSRSRPVVNTTPIGPPTPNDIPVAPNTQAPATQPRVTVAPGTVPRATSAPTTAAPRATTATTRPPATAAPTTRPPATAAPTTARPRVTTAPTTATPTTRPPTTAPPTTRPPMTAPPTTRPTVTAPVNTRPAVTAPGNGAGNGVGNSAGGG